MEKSKCDTDLTNLWSTIQGEFGNIYGLLQLLHIGPKLLKPCSPQWSVSHLGKEGHAQVPELVIERDTKGVPLLPPLDSWPLVFFPLETHKSIFYIVYYKGLSFTPLLPESVSTDLMQCYEEHPCWWMKHFSTESRAGWGPEERWGKLRSRKYV